MTDKELKDWCKTCNVEPPAMKFKCPECEHNTDNENIFARDINVSRKEQIIIDGVEVLKEKINMCFILLLKNKLETPETIEQTIYEHLDAFVKEWNTQLARKTHECEELKDYARRQENQRETYYKEFLKKNRALEEIEEYVQSQLDGFGNDVYLMHKVAINKILNIINKAKGEENVF